jgi:hypothetical protein
MLLYSLKNRSVGNVALFSSKRTARVRDSRLSIHCQEIGS